MWVDRNGRSVSPPPRSPGYKPTFKKVLVSVEDGLALGLMIRGGAEYRLGIYITGVDEGSAADLAGLQFGDQILSVNEVDFTSITHDEAVRILESSARMSVVVRSEGRVPHSNDPAYSPQATPYAAGPSSSSDGWYQDPMTHRTELSRKGSPRKREHSLDESAVNPGTAERRLDRKARQLLSESQRLTLAYYCNEYETGAMAVHDFVPLLLKLLETTDKQSLLKEIRALVPSKDLGKFDELMYRRELQTRKSKDSMKLSVEIRAEHADDHESPPGEILRNLSPRATFRASTRRRQQDKHHLSVPTSREDMHTPSEDSGVDLPNGTLFPHGSRKGSRVSSASRDSMTLDAKSLQRKPSPSRLWRLSPRGSVGGGGTSPRLRRAAFRRHSSGGEGGGGGRAPEDRRWSIGEMVDAPYVEGHLVSGS